MKILRYSLFVLVFLSRGILSSIILLITFYGCKDNKFSKKIVRLARTVFLDLV